MILSFPFAHFVHRRSSLITRIREDAFYVYKKRKMPWNTLCIPQEKIKSVCDCVCEMITKKGKHTNRWKNDEIEGVCVWTMPNTKDFYDDRGNYKLFLASIRKCCIKKAARLIVKLLIHMHTYHIQISTIHTIYFFKTKTTSSSFTLVLFWNAAGWLWGLEVSSKYFPCNVDFHFHMHADAFFLCLSLSYASIMYFISFYPHHFFLSFHRYISPPRILQLRFFFCSSLSMTFIAYRLTAFPHFYCFVSHKSFNFIEAIV